MPLHEISKATDGRSARIDRTTSQTITTSTFTNVSFEAEVFDHGGMADLGAQPTRLTIPAGLGGRYIVCAGVQWDTNATGLRFLGIQVNGTTSIVEATQTAAGGGFNTAQVATTIIDLASGDFLTARVFQSSGTDRTLSGNDLTFLTAALISA